MKIETQNLDDHQVKLSVVTETGQFEASKKSTARRLSKSVKIPGFRPGKAPYSIIERHLGEARIIEESIESFINNIYQDIIEKAEIKPYGPGKIEEISSYDPFSFDLIVPLEAQVTLGDYRATRIKFEEIEVTDSDVDEVLEEIRDSQAVIEPVERPAQAGDQVVIQIKGSDRKASSEDDAAIVPQRSIPVIVNENDKDDGEPEEWPYNGFSKELLGLSSGDERDIEHDYTEESPFEDLRGKGIDFNIVVKDVKSRTLPELDDDFANNLGEYSDMVTLKSRIRENLEEKAEREQNDKYDLKILEEIIADSEIKYPPQMLDQEVEAQIQQLKSRLEANNLDINIYMKSRGIEKDELRQDILPVAENSLEQSLVIYEISEQENVQIDKDELQKVTDETMEQINQFDPPKNMRNFSKDELASRLISNIAVDMVTKSTMNRLRDIAMGKIDFENEDEGNSDISEEKVDDSTLSNKDITEETQSDIPQETAD